MLCMKIISILTFITLCTCDTSYLLRSYPTDSTVTEMPFKTGPCLDPLTKLTFLQGADDTSFNHSECSHDSDESILTCKLGLIGASSLDLDQYPLDSINVLILFVQEFPAPKLRTRVLDLCFINRFGKSLQELAICGYRPPVIASPERTSLHILDIPALAIVSSNIHTLLIGGVNLWQSVELRQFPSLKNLLIVQGRTLPMYYFHSPLCADCEGGHPRLEFSFHYLIPLSSQLTYFLYESYFQYDSCRYDLLKKIRSSGSIATLIVASVSFKNDLDKPICETCQNGLCPLLSVCLDETSSDRRDKDKPFECLCVEEVAVENEFQSCKPMTLHQPMYSTRCNHTPSFWNYVSRSMIIASIYLLSSIIVFIISTIFLIKSDQ